MNRKRLLVPVVVLICAVSVGVNVAYALPARETAQTSDDTAGKHAAEHAAEDLVGTSIGLIEQKTNENKTRLTREQGVQPGTARSQKIGAGEATYSTGVTSDPGVSGQWSPVIDTPLVPVFQAVLPNGKVLAWDSVGDNAVESYPDHTFTRAMVWNPADNTYKRVDVQGYNIFCAGFAHMPNGNIFVAGGNKDAGQNGIVQTHIFNWKTESWSRGPDMASGRWYPSVAAMANGENVIVGGGPATPEAYETNGLLRSLVGLTDNQYGDRVYPWMISRPDTLLGLFGPYNATHSANVSGIGVTTGTGNRDGIYRDYGSYAPYDIGKALIAGGGNISEGGQNNVPTKTSVIVNNNAGLTPTVAATGAMSVGRRQMNTTVLADGSVLATGGETSAGAGGLVDLNHAATAAERWDPATGNWQVLSSASRIRQYHSAASLLPDGRVVTGGGGICRDCVSAGYLEKNIEYFSPPYMFKKDGSGALAARPSASRWPATISINTSFNLSTLGTTPVSKIALVGLSDVTHDVNQGQRYIPLNFTVTSVNTGSPPAVNYNIVGPATGGVAPPGHYMLFVIDNAGVPSIAKTVQVLQAPNPTMSPVQNAASGRCIDVPSSSTANATYLWAFDCNSTGAQAATRIGTDSSIRVLGNCIDVPGSNFVSGQGVWAFACNSTNAQKWQFNGDGTIRPTAAQGLCLAAASTTNRAPLNISTCIGSALQQWNLQVGPPPSPETSPVRNVASNTCIDAPFSSTAIATYLWTFDCNGTGAQALTRTLSDNSVRVLGNCIDVPFSSFVSGQRVWTYGCNGTNAQAWQFGIDSTIRPIAQQGLCLAAASTANQAQLIIATCNGSGLQKWSW